MRKKILFTLIALALVLGVAGLLNAESYYSELGPPAILNNTQAQVLLWNGQDGQANTTRIRLINVVNNNEENATSFKLWLVHGNASSPYGNQTYSNSSSFLSWTAVPANGTLQIDYQAPGAIMSTRNGTLQGVAANGPGNLTLMFFGVKE